MDNLKDKIGEHQHSRHGGVRREPRKGAESDQAQQKFNRGPAIVGCAYLKGVLV
jgi:hypothetical protein